MRATDKTHRPIYMTAAMAMTVLLAATVLLAQDNPELSRQAAEQGDAEAQYNLGFMYAEGLGVSKDEPEWVRWYRLGADQGDAVAQLELGLMLMLMSDAGEGVSKDEPELVRWYRLGADQGLPWRKLWCLGKGKDNPGSSGSIDDYSTYRATRFADPI